jgi:Rrf2 family protein
LGQLVQGVRFSLQVQYAICGVFDLAYNGHGEPVQIRVISERQGIPARYLEQIFARLRRRDLITAKRGPGGGYTLTRTAATITLRQVVEAVEGPLADSFLMQDDAGAAARRRRPDFLWPTLADGIGQVLDTTTFEHLCLQASRTDVPRAEAEAPMYFI